MNDTISLSEKIYLLGINPKKGGIVMAANSAMVLLYWDMGKAILEYQLRDGDTLGQAVERARAKPTTSRDVRISKSPMMYTATKTTKTRGKPKTGEGASEFVRKGIWSPT